MKLVTGVSVVVFWIGATVVLAQEPTSPTTSETIWRGSRDIYAKLKRDEFPKIVHADFADDEWPSTYVIRNTPNLRTLVVGGPRCTDDAILPDIEKAKSLRTLVLDSTNVTDQGIEQFQERRPDVLVLRSQRWAIRQLRSLSPELRMDTRFNEQHPELRQLLGDALLEEVTGFDTYNLPQEAERPVERFTDLQLMPLKYLDTLTHLNLTWSEITDAGLQYVKECQRLEHLQLPLGMVSDKALIQCARQLRKLKTLRIEFPRYVGYPDAARERYELLQAKLRRVSVTCYSLDKLDQGEAE